MKPIGLLLLGIVLAGTPAHAQRVDEAAAQLKRGKVFFHQKDFAGAIASFTKAIELKPTWAEAYLQRGYARRMHGVLDLAIEDYDKAAELDPRTTQNNRAVAEAYTNRGQIRCSALQFAEAITDFNRATKLFPGDLRPIYHRAQARLLLEDFRGAITDYDYFLSHEKYDPWSRALAFAERSLTKHFLGQDEDGMKDVEESLKLAGKGKEEILRHMEFLERQVSYLRHLRAQKRGLIGRLRSLDARRYYEPSLTVGLLPGLST